MAILFARLTSSLLKIVYDSNIFCFRLKYNNERFISRFAATKPGELSECFGEFCAVEFS